MRKLILLGVSIVGSLTAFAKNKVKYAVVAEHNTHYYQVIDTVGNLIIDSVLQPQWTAPYGLRYDEGIFKFERNGRLGYKDLRNRVVLSAQYDELSDFVNGAGITQKDGQMGLIDRKGAWVIEPVYQYITPVNVNGLLLVIDSLGLLGLMDIHGKTILKPTFRPFQAKPVFNDGLLAVAVQRLDINPPGYSSKQTDLHIGFIDTQGTLVIDTVWTTDRGMWRSFQADRLSNQQYLCPSGISRQQSYAEEDAYHLTHDYYRFEGGRALVRKDGVDLVINEKGNVLFALPDTLESIYNTGGLFRFNNQKRAAIQHTSPVYGLYDGKGHVVQLNQYTPEGEFRSGYLLVKLGEASYQYLDTTGYPAFGGRSFRHAYSFSDGYAMVFVDNKGTVTNCLLDTKGQLRCIDSTVMPSHTVSDNGWFTISKRSGWGFIDSLNNVTIPPVYSSLYRFWNGYCGYRASDGKAGYINEKNKIVIPAKYFDVMDFQVLSN